MRLAVLSMIQMTTFMNGDDILGFEFVYGYNAFDTAKSNLWRDQLE